MSTLASPNPVVARGLHLTRRLQPRRDPARPLAGNRYPVHVATKAVVVLTGLCWAQRLYQKASESTSQRRRQVNPAGTDARTGEFNSGALSISLMSLKRLCSRH